MAESWLSTVTLAKLVTEKKGEGSAPALFLVGLGRGSPLLSRVCSLVLPFPTHWQDGGRLMVACLGVHSGSIVVPLLNRPA